MIFFRTRSEKNPTEKPTHTVRYTYPKPILTKYHPKRSTLKIDDFRKFRNFRLRIRSPGDLALLRPEVEQVARVTSTSRVSGARGPRGRVSSTGLTSVLPVTRTRDGEAGGALPATPDGPEKIPLFCRICPFSPTLCSEIRESALKRTSKNDHLRTMNPHEGVKK